MCCAGLAEVCHESNVPLIVDEAHGSHFAFHSAFPQVGSCHFSVMQFIHFVYGRPLLWLLQDWLAKRIAACLQFGCLSLCACLPHAVCLQNDFASCPAMHYNCKHHAYIHRTCCMHAEWLIMWGRLCGTVQPQNPISSDASCNAAHQRGHQRHRPCQPSVAAAAGLKLCAALCMLYCTMHWVIVLFVCFELCSFHPPVAPFLSLSSHSSLTHTVVNYFNIEFAPVLLAKC